jgi:antirestriction protein ArdC
MPNIYESITDKIVSAIEAGAGDWRMPWHTRAGEESSVQPVSISTGKRYRGMNTILLWCAQQERGYDSALWGTFNS